ncbi:MAG: DNA adenine methylase [Bacteroidales bacterium]|nr:DNA adenine methylase [Bacteroidales bacterium]
MTYGIPYKGSKNAIAERIIDILPPAEVFVDLFAGGCAMTHAALLSGKWRRFIINDVNPLPTRLFVDAIGGAYRNERRVFTREDFQAMRDDDPYCAYCWSFGSNGREYLWGAEIEEVKVLASRMIMEDDWRRRYELFQRLVPMLAPHIGEEGIDRLHPIERLDRVRKLEGIERLDRVRKLKVLAKDWREVELPDDATIYCDIPYAGSSHKYAMERERFSHREFHDWARGINRPVFISEYSMPDDFVPIWSAVKTSSYSATDKGHKTVERVFLHERWAKDYTNGLFEHDGYGE